jgi:hypothetical protein
MRACYNNPERWLVLWVIDMISDGQEITMVAKHFVSGRSDD